MILFFGKSGQLAQSFQAKIPNELDGQVVFVSSHEVNFLEARRLPGFLDHYSPEIVVICSAYTQVDLAETETDLAEKINFRAPQEIARWAARNGSRVIHFSTDYVYSDLTQNPILETQKPNPINHYGLTKLQGDEAIQFTGCDHFIFRTSWVYSEFGKNFLKTMLKLGATKTELRVVSDQVGSPTYAPDMADMIWKIILSLRQGQKFPSGVYHLAGNGFVSWAQFAEAIFAEAQKLKFDLKIEKVLPILSADYPTSAHRPLNSRLDISKFEKTFQMQMPSWQESMSLCLRRLRSLNYL